MNRHKRGIELQKILTKSILKKEYIDNKLSSHKIAEKYNTNHTTVNKYLKKYEFCIRNKSESLIGRKRDILTCQNCGCKESNHHRANKQIALTVHHIDYNKMNCKENNLITVCNRCNIKANANIDYWFAYYKYQIKTIKETI